MGGRIESVLQSRLLFLLFTELRKGVFEKGRREYAVYEVSECARGEMGVCAGSWEPGYDDSEVGLALGGTQGELSTILFWRFPEVCRFDTQ